MRIKALTLIELLVVLVVIGLLIAILLPVLGKGRAMARSALCCNNLRQLSLAAILFNEDRGYYPSSYITSEIAGVDAKPEPEFLPEYLDNDKEVLRCPEVKGYFDDAPPVISYGWFWYKAKDAGGAGSIFPAIMEKETSHIPMFADSDSMGISNQYVLDLLNVLWNPVGGHPESPADFDGDGDVDLDDLSALDDNWWGSGCCRHNDYLNIIYLDGHAGRIRRELPPNPL